MLARHLNFELNFQSLTGFLPLLCDMTGFTSKRDLMINLEINGQSILRAFRPVQDNIDLEALGNKSDKTAHHNNFATVSNETHQLLISQLIASIITETCVTN